MCFAPQRRIFLWSKPSKMAERGVLYILTYKCASRHSGVPFFPIEPSKSGSDPSGVFTFWLKMCFAPQRRAIFPDRNFQNGSEAEVFCTFWLTNVLRATAACHFSGSQLPKWLRAEVFCTFWLTNVLRATAACHFSGSQLAKWLRSWGVLYILTYKCASRHSGVQFFITPLSSYLRTRRFYEATFRTAGTTNHWKNTAIRDVANISRTCIFSPDCCTWLHCLSTLLDCCCTLLFYTTFQLSILSEVSTLNFLCYSLH